MEGIDIKELRKRTQRNVSKDESKEKKEPDESFWSFLNKDIKFGSSGLKDKTKESFYLELSTLLTAGMDIRSILEMIAAEQKNKTAKAIFNQLLKDIVQGASLSAALHNSSKFSRYEYYSILIGEESGKMIEVLKDLANYFKKKIQQRRQIVGALTYPAVVLLVAVGAVSFMIGYVVPMFSDVFKRFGGELPAITKFVIDVADVFKASIKYVVLIILSGAGYLYWHRNTEWFRRYSAQVVLKTPIVGDIIHKIYLSRFSNTMALLTSARVSLVQSLDLTQKMISFYPVENALTNVKSRIEEGVPFFESLSQHNIFPSKMIAFVKVGEQVNQLELFFNRLSEQYADEVEYQTSIMSKLLEPLIIVVLGLVVSVILIAMYLPMFKLGQPI